MTTLLSGNKYATQIWRKIKNKTPLQKKQKKKIGISQFTGWQRCWGHICFPCIWMYQEWNIEWAKWNTQDKNENLCVLLSETLTASHDFSQQEIVVYPCRNASPKTLWMNSVPELSRFDTSASCRSRSIKWLSDRHL